VLGSQPPGREHQGIRGRPVQPLGVVHHTQRGAVLGGRRQHTQHRGRDQQAVSVRGRRDPKCAGQRPGLNIRQLAQVAKDRPQQFVQPGEGQVRFGLHPGRGQHRHRRGSLACVVQQRRLADPGLTPHHQRSASTRAGIRQQPVDDRALGLSPKQPRALSL